MTKNTPFIAVLILALNILIVWLPNQFQTAGIQEEWRYRAPFDGGVTTYNDIGSDSSEEQFFTRPMYGLMNGLSYVLFPESFMGHHVILITLLLLKGIAMFLVFSALFPDHPLWGFFCALLLIFYPSDAGIVSFRTFHHHLTIATILFSVYFFVRYYNSSKRIHLVLMWIAQLIAALSAETGYPVFFIIPVIILLLEKRFSRKFFILTALYYIIPAITFAYSVYLILGVQTSWQRTALVSYSIRDYLKIILNVYVHNFIDTWRSIIDHLITASTNSDKLVFSLTTLVTTLGGFAIMRLNPTNPIENKRNLFMTFGIAIIFGFVIVLAGYGMFLISRTHVLTDFRVYMLSSVGATIVVITTLYALYHLSSQAILRSIIILIFAVIVGLAGVFANETHHEFLDVSNTQEHIIQQITDVVPALSQPAYIVIKTPSNEINYRVNIDQLQKPVLFTPMLQVVYNDYENVLGGVICFKDYLTCDFSSADGMGIQASNFLNLEPPIPYDQVILFNITKNEDIILITEDENLRGYNPMALIDTSADPPSRIASIYGAE